MKSPYPQRQQQRLKFIDQQLSIKTLLPEAEVKVCLRRRTQMILQKTVGFTDLYTDWTLQ